MAHSQHLEWLLEGVDRWNARRAATPFRPFLMNADIYGEFNRRGLLDPNGRARLNRFNLSQANLIGANLRNVDFFEADLREAKLNADLRSADFHQANLTDAEINLAIAGNAGFGSATLDNADLIQTNLVDVELGWSQVWTAQLYEPGGSVSQLDSIVCQGHPITGVSSFLDFFRNIESQYGIDVVYYFRGESTTGWELRPAVMRYDRNTNSFAFRSKEHAMLTDLMSRRPEEFTDATSALSQWVIAQHHGLKTRFLDVTKDPLVALFNACSDPSNLDAGGLLHILAVPRWLVKPFNDVAVSIIANFAKLNRTDQNTILTKTGTQMQEQDPDVNIDSLYLRSIRQLGRLVREEKPWFEEQMIDVRDFFRVVVVEPQQSIERIRAQSGAFLVSAFHERFERDEILKWNDAIPVYANYTVTIPSRCKGQIMEDLNLLGVTHEKLFPGLDSSAAAITGFYQRRL